VTRRVLVAAGVLLAASLFASRGAWPWGIVRRTPTPTLAEIFTETRDTLRRGETVGELFTRQGAASFRLSSLSDPAVLDARRLRAGLVFNFQKRPTDSTPSRVVVRTGPEQRVTLTPVADGWNASAEVVPWAADTLVVDGTIASSLYEALDGEGSDSILEAPARIQLAWDLADVFAWQVDFSRDLRDGDTFRVVAERIISDEGEVRFRRVLAAELLVDGRLYTAYSFSSPEARGYYDADGRSLRRAFLLAPVQFRRISSRLGSRRHPILGLIRQHEGIDYAADPGTEVLAAGDGVVVRRVWAGGYGNLVEIRHKNGITTRYGHLRGFARGIVTGGRVRQGEVVGYVGSTGLATGPHLHYEFRVNGVARDPRKVDLGNGEPVPPALRTAFDLERERFVDLLARGPVASLASSPR
jgi:murein DD-endopeptidase MepM/ murein hydrolase activator NlpD